MEEIDNIVEVVLHYLRGIWKNRWIAIAIAWPLLMAGVVAVDQIKDRYTAETKVYIDTTSVLKPLLRGLAIQSDFQAIVRLMINKILSRPNLERAARLMDMDIDIQTPKQMEALIAKIRSRVSISAKSRSNTYTITYTDEDRTLAKEMVQTLLDIFVEDTLGTSVTESDSAISFLDGQIEKYDQLLQEAEARREQFKRKNVGLMPQDGANYYTQLEAGKTQLEQATLLVNESINRRDKIQLQLDKLTSSSVSNNVVVTSSLDDRINDQEVKLQDLLLLYTEQHPDVINASLVLESLKKRRVQELEKLQNNSRDNSSEAINNNPVYQELLVLLTTTEADISSYRIRVASLENKQIKLKKLVNVVPRIEAELQRLNRDYEVHKTNYTEFVKRREQARISEDVESGTEQVKFRIIEPPFVPLRATFPNRALFDAAALFLALGIGYGISLLISLFQPVFYNQHELGTGLGYAVLGTISKFDTHAVLSSRRRNMAMFFMANMLLVTVSVIFMVIHSKGVLILSTIQMKVMAL